MVRLFKIVWKWKSTSDFLSESALGSENSGKERRPWKVFGIVGRESELQPKRSWFPAHVWRNDVLCYQDGRRTRKKSDIHVPSLCLACHGGGGGRKKKVQPGTRPLSAHVTTTEKGVVVWISGYMLRRS